MKTKGQAETEAHNVVRAWATGAALTGWMPGSTLFLAGADLVMAKQVAEAFGINTFDPQALGAEIASATAGSVAGGVIAEGVGWIPVVGWAVKSGMMSAKAKVIGDIVIGYFKQRSPLAD